jgi:hypothetical protein
MNAVPRGPAFYARRDETLLDHHQTDSQHMTSPAAVPALHRAMLNF